MPSPLAYVLLAGGALLMLPVSVVKRVGQNLPVAQFLGVHGANESVRLWPSYLVQHQVC